MVKTDQQTTEKWLAWTANLPATWSVRQLKYLAAVISSNVDKKTVEGEEPVRLCNYVDVYHNDRITSDLDFMNASATAVEIEKFTLRKDDVIITKDSESADDIAVPAHVVDDLDGVLCGYHLAVIRPRSHNLCGRFLFYCFAADIINHQFAVSAKGITRFGLSLGALGNALFPLPSLHDQHIIADFLDEKTAAIDSLIAKKERLIELIEEKRQATITHAVTKGLDPDVPMKDSGVEWLGEVPAHWQVAPVYARYSVQLGKMLNPEASAGDHQAPYLRNANVQWGRVVLQDLREMSFTPAERRKFELRPGDLLVCEGGDVGRTAVWSGELEECYYQKAIHRLRPYGPQDNSRFFYYVMRAAAHRGAFLADGNQSTIIHLTAEKLRRYRFAFPPLDEQGAIVDCLDRQVQRSENLVEREEQLITRLREYRQALISAAVTGQLDVRSRAARALDPTVPEPLEEVLT